MPPETLLQEANTRGFNAEFLEKVFRLMEFLNEIFSNTFLKNRVVLKGGSALNLFYLNLNRLSVDIDLNYIGQTHVKAMKQERVEVERILVALAERVGLTNKRIPTKHAGGKWRFTYPSLLQARNIVSNLEVDLAYLYRIPLWPVVKRDSATIGNYQAKDISMLDIHELISGKLCALFSRCASRDLYDIYALLIEPQHSFVIDRKKLRKGFLIYGAMNRTDWRTISVDNITIDLQELKSKLLVVIHNEAYQKNTLKKWANELIEKCKAALHEFTCFTENEVKFLNEILDKGNIEPGYLTDDKELHEKILNHPGLLWKAQNVRNYRKRSNAMPDKLAL